MATGVQFPNVIDLVSHDQATDVVTLSMIEERPWDGSSDRILQLQAKIHNYVGFALDGHFEKLYPAFVGKPIAIALRCTAQPDPETAKFITEIAQRLEAYKIGLEVQAPAEDVA